LIFAALAGARHVRTIQAGHVRVRLAATTSCSDCCFTPSSWLGIGKCSAPAEAALPASSGREITSALDVSVQATALEPLRDLRHARDVALLFITHDLGVVAAVADEVLVLENGRICESGQTATLLARPRHPYTQRLLQAAPSLTEAIGARGMVET
jgi:hypothetical protein